MKLLHRLTLVATATFALLGGGNSLALAQPAAPDPMVTSAPIDMTDVTTIPHDGLSARLTNAELDAIQGDGWRINIKKMLKKLAKWIGQINPVLKVITDIIIWIIERTEQEEPDNPWSREDHHQAEWTESHYFVDDAAMEADNRYAADERLTRDYEYQYTVTYGGGGGGGGGCEQGCDPY